MTMNHWYQSMYQMFELCSDFIEAWLCYGFVGLFLPDRLRGKVPFLSCPWSWWALSGPWIYWAWTL